MKLRWKEEGEEGMHADVKGSALMQVTIASCIGHSNGVRACPDPL